MVECRLDIAGLRVALVHDWLTGMRGGERVLEVFCDIFPQAEIFTLFHFPGSVSARIERHPIHVSPLLARLPGIERNYRRFLPLFPWAIRRFDLSGFDLILSSSHCVAKGVRTGGRPHLCYCHTPVRYLWDRYDDYFGAGRSVWLRAAARGIRGPIQRWDVASNSDVHEFIANSAHVAGRIRTHYGRESRVIHPPVDTERFRLSSGAPGDAYLIVSAFAPYKRIDLAIDAVRELGRSLVIVGDGPERPRLERRARGADVRFAGRASEEEVVRAMANCRALILPGEEDFGITPLEAMASGRPVVALGRGGALETVVDLRDTTASAPTGVLFPEPSPASLADAIRDLERHAERIDPAALRRHAERFSVERFRGEIEAALRTFVLSSSRRSGQATGEDRAPEIDSSPDGADFPGGPHLA